MTERAGVRMVRVADLCRGNVVCDPDGSPLYVVEALWRIGEAVRIEGRRPDGSTFEEEWREPAGEERRVVSVASSLPRTVVILGGVRAYPVAEVGEMAREVLRYVVAVEDALPERDRAALPGDLRASAYGILRTLTQAEE